MYLFAVVTRTPGLWGRTLPGHTTGDILRVTIMDKKTQPMLVSNDTDYCDGTCQADSSFCGMFGVCRSTKGFIEVPYTKGVIP